MTLNRLPHIQAKLRRAEEHLAEFYDVLLGRKGPIRCPHSGSLSRDPIAKQFVYVGEAHDTSIETNVIIGDAIHQFRAILDHLIYGVCEIQAPTGADLSQVYFPISKSQSDYLADKRAKTLRGLVKQCVMTELEACQPFRRHPNAPGESPLFILHKLDILDKHCSVLKLSHTLDLSSGLTFKQTVMPGKVMFEVAFPDNIDPDQLSMQEFAPRVVFDESVGGSEILLEVMDGVKEEVVEVVNRLSQFF